MLKYVFFSIYTIYAFTAVHEIYHPTCEVGHLSFLADPSLKPQIQESLKKGGYRFNVTKPEMSIRMSFGLIYPDYVYPYDLNSLHPRLKQSFDENDSRFISPTYTNDHVFKYVFLDMKIPSEFYPLLEKSNYRSIRNNGNVWDYKYINLHYGEQRIHSSGWNHINPGKSGRYRAQERYALRGFQMDVPYCVVIPVEDFDYAWAEIAKDIKEE